MTILKILSVLLSLAFTLFGYFVFFQKKYSLINGFQEDYKAGRKTEAYAKWVGLVEFILGIVLLVVSVILFLLF